MNKKIQALKTLFSLHLLKNEFAFIFLGSSGIILRNSSYSIAFDIGKCLDKSELAFIDHLEFLFITHNHGDHYKSEYVIELFKQTGAQIVADSLSYEDLKSCESIDQNRLILADSGTFSNEYKLDSIDFVALRGIHVEPINQYLVNLGNVKIYHAGDSGFWEHKKFTTDIAFVPVGTARTCSPEVALGLVTDLKAKIAIPIHGRKNNMKRFIMLKKNVLPDINVFLPKKFNIIKISLDTFDVIDN